MKKPSIGRNQSIGTGKSQGTRELFLPRQSRITLIGNRELVVDGCRGILEYRTDLIRLNLGDKQLHLMGSGLVVQVLEGEYAQIGGQILSINFS